MRSLITNARELLARLMEEEDDESSDDETSSVASLALGDDHDNYSSATHATEDDDPSSSNTDSRTVALPLQASVAPPPSPTSPSPQTPQEQQEQQELVVDLTASDDAQNDQSAEDDEDKDDDDDDEAIEVVGTTASTGRTQAITTSATRPLRLSTGGIGSRFMGIIVDDDDSDDDSDSDHGHHNENGNDDDDDDDAVIVTNTVAPATAATATAGSASASPSRLGRKRPRSEIASASSNDVVVVETQVVFKSQPTECLICCDACTIAGPHRLVALKCGHLFGRQCIERWIQSRKVCPNCNVAVRKPDIRPLFSDHVAVVDNAGIVEMTEKFEAEREKRIQLEKELALIEQQHQNEVARQKREVQRLNEVVRDLQRGVSSSKSSSTASLSTPQRHRDGPGSASKARWR